MTKKEMYLKIEYYSTEITKEKPYFDTVFRIYYDSLVLIKRILGYINENPWHPENDNSSVIFEDIEECFEELEKLRLKSTRTNQ